MLEICLRGKDLKKIQHYINKEAKRREETFIGASCYISGSMCLGLGQNYFMCALMCVYIFLYFPIFINGIIVHKLKYIKYTCT